MEGPGLQKVAIVSVPQTRPAKLRSAAGSASVRCSDTIYRHPSPSPSPALHLRRSCGGICSALRCAVAFM